MFSAPQETASFEGRPQRYKESAGKLKAAVEHLRQLHEEQPLAFLLTCGDIVDGYPASDSNAETKTSRDLQLVVGTIRTALQPLPVHHVLGNHCLRAARQELLGVCHCCGDPVDKEPGAVSASNCVPAPEKLCIWTHRIPNPAAGV